MKLFSISLALFLGALFLVLTGTPTNQRARVSAPKMAAHTLGSPERISLKSVSFHPEVSDFEAQFLDGAQRKLRDFGGKIVLVNFWATWCAPCKAEIPELLEVYREKRAHFTIIGIAEASELDEVRSFVKEMKIDYPIALDPDGKIAMSYDIFGYPTSYLLAPDGALARRYDGFLPEDVLRKDLAELEKKYAK